ncbi:MAG: TonB-dependent receptor [Kiritimatiellia bacterium]|jgi:hemoglobin/transferrin/lactoferrin receptor protein|nr:TonB-dependent receptor [Kiritimatiellia bacterium]MDP6631154.1 TonB-dependent receptor [Kiritimatiellia bacterium]MDP6809824.1 TonB-dependent receptor [Kiritimatiellia bacterium]MDP7025066.1 TonB-dependent receptor [Kiritimatiellia bacterium]
MLDSRFGLACGAGITVAGVLLSCAVYAEPTNTTVVVTATRDARNLQDAPYATSVLSSDVLRLEKAVRTVPEALGDEPSTMVQKTAHGQGSPYIRGFTSQRNLFMVDGVRLNNSVFREGPNQYWNTVDAMSLDRIELVRGPFSSLYGSDAVGGTVNALTRGVRDIRPGSTWDRTLNYRYSSAEDSHVARAESIGQLTGDLALTLGTTFKEFGDVEGGKEVGTQPFTAYDEQDWDAKLEYFLTDDSFFVLAHQSASVDDAWRTHKTIYGTDWEGLSVGSELRRVLDQARELTTLQYHQFNGDGFAEEIHAGVSHQLQSEERDRLRSGDRHDVQGFDVHTYGAFVSFKSPSVIGDLIYGAEFYHDEVDSFKNSYNPDGSLKSSAIQGPVGDDATYDTLGIYVQDELPLAERLSLILGGRYEYAEAEANEVEDPVTGEQIVVGGDWDAVVGSARLLYALNAERSWNAFAGISQGFRAPNLSDLTRLDSARTDEIETPSPDLDPEDFVSYEIGVKADTARASAQLAFFHTEIDGMIVRTPTGRMIDDDFEVTKKNGGDGFVQGLEFDARYRLCDALTVFGVFTWMDGELDTYPTSDSELVSETIDRLMPPTGKLGLRWDIGARTWVEGACTVAGAGDKLSTRDRSDTSRIPPGGTPGYTVYDVRAGWTPCDHMTLSLAVENITDEDYRVHGSGLNEPGQNLVLAMQTSF